MNISKKFWSRRDFIAGVARTSAALPLAASVTARSNTFTAQISNAFFDVAFDTATGLFDVRRSGGEPFLSGARAVAVTDRGQRDTGQSAYSHSLEARAVHDPLGDGRELIVTCADALQQLNLQLRITLYEGLPSLFVQLTCENVGRQPSTVSNVQPLCAIPAGGGLHWDDVAKILTNGQMYADPGAVSELTSDSRRSWWNVAFFRGYEREGLVCGSIDNAKALGQLSVGRGANGLIALTAESFLAHSFVLQPGRTISSNRFMLHIGENPYQALESYADTMGRLGVARIHSVVNGWCSWFYTYESVTEEEVIRNAEYAARMLKPFGFEYVQVDEGYQRWHGDWEGNEKFPHGMGWLAEHIRELGLKPGLWIAPYIISEPT
ncbi:alpha-galactosidase, partial [candidate division KSB1 bacterium]|nr:alpha-galactosidase [candidate division KSB1 bacterium]